MKEFYCRKCDTLMEAKEGIQEAYDERTQIHITDLIVWYVCPKCKYEFEDDGDY